MSSLSASSSLLSCLSADGADCGQIGLVARSYGNGQSQKSNISTSSGAVIQWLPLEMLFPPPRTPATSRGRPVPLLGVGRWDVGELEIILWDRERTGELGEKESLPLLAAFLNIFILAQIVHSQHASVWFLWIFVPLLPVTFCFLLESTKNLRTGQRRRGKKAGYSKDCWREVAKGDVATFSEDVSVQSGKCILLVIHWNWVVFMCFYSLN